MRYQLFLYFKMILKKNDLFLEDIYSKYKATTTTTSFT